MTESLHASLASIHPEIDLYPGRRDAGDRRIPGPGTVGPVVLARYHIFLLRSLRGGPGAFTPVPDLAHRVLLRNSAPNPPCPDNGYSRTLGGNGGGTDCIRGACLTGTTGFSPTIVPSGAHAQSQQSSRNRYRIILRVELYCRVFSSRPATTLLVSSFDCSFLSVQIAATRIH